MPWPGAVERAHREVAVRDRDVNVAAEDQLLIGELLVLLRELQTLVAVSIMDGRNSDVT